jgi:hypothetical protein
MSLFAQGLASIEGLHYNASVQPAACATPFSEGLLDISATSPPPNKKTKKGLFCNENYRSACHIQFLNDHRAIAKAERANTALRQGHASTDRAWNKERVRHGDTIGGTGDDFSIHPNQYNTPSILVLAWKQIGKNKVLRSGIDGIHRALTILVAVANAIDEMQSIWMRDETEDVRTRGDSLVITRYYDCTPVRLRFGRLQDQVMPHARYPLLNAEGKWKSVPFQEYRKINSKHAKPKFGTVDLLAQGVTCHYMDSDTNYLHGFRAMCKPTILQRGNASCLFSACESEVPSLNCAGLNRIAERSPFILLNEVPDASTVNKRKKAKTFQKLNDNIFATESSCAAHQGHRIIEQPEKDMVGNVHAVHVTCSHVHNQVRMQAAFKTLLGELDYHIGEPDPEWTKRNRSIMVRTILRRDLVVAPGLHEPLELKNAVERFLRYWNGDWTKPRVAHYCHGPNCCGNETDAIELMFATAMEIDLFLSRDVGTPTMDDWATCGNACGKISGGILIHDILRRVLILALPTWSAMLPPNDRTDVPQDSIEKFRMKLQKKAWRSKCFLGDELKRLKCLLLCWIAAYVERLMSALQHRDVHNKGLLDIVFEDSSNPFWAARASISSMLRRGASGPLGMLFSFFPEEMHAQICRSARGMGLNFIGQLYWRFLHFTGFPFRFVALAHNGLTRAQRFGVVKEFHELKECCRCRHFGQKVFNMFDTAEDLFTDVDFARLMVVFGYSFKFCNMWCERLLALIRQSCDGDGVDIERVCASGLVAQLLADHRRRGRDDPCSTTRGQLLEDNVPLQCASSGELHVRGAFVNWMMKAESERKKSVGSLPKEEYKKWQRAKALEFSCLEQGEKDSEMQQSRAAFSEKEVEREEEQNIEMDRHIGEDFLRTIVDGLGDRRTPFTSTHFEAYVRTKLGVPSGARTPGFTAYEEPLRDEFDHKLFRIDQGEIDDAEVFEYYTPCGLAHPELCANDHSWCLPQIREASKNLGAILKGSSDGSFHWLRFGGHAESATWFALSYRRGGNPKLVVLSPCVADYDKLVVCLDCDSDDKGPFEQLIEKTFVGRIVACSRDACVDEIFYAPAPIDEARLPASICEGALLLNWEEIVRSTEVRVFPSSQKAAKVKVDRTFKKGLASLIEKPSHPPRRHAGIRHVIPGGGDEVSDSESSSNHSDGKSTESEPGPSCAAPSTHGKRDLRSIPFGPWTISQLGPIDSPTGWGGNCHRHSNAAQSKNTACKKEFAYIGHTSDQTRCLVKKWLLMGVDIPSDDPSGRKKHVLDVQRDHIPLCDEAELDAEAAALM